MDGHPTFDKAIPLGNGDLTALVWVNVTTGSVEMYVRKMDGQGSSADTMVLSHVLYTLTPNPFQTGPYFNHTLDLAQAAMSVCGGGSGGGNSNASACFTLYVHAASNDILLEADSLDGVSRSLSITTLSVRPSTRTTYPLSWNCFSASSEPDVFLDPLPPSLFPPPYNSSTLVQYHRNSPNDTSLITTHLFQQNITSLLPFVADPWTNNTFGVAVSGVCSGGSGGGGVPLARTSPTTLHCTTPSLHSTARLTAFAAQTPTEEGWVEGLAAAAIATPPPPLSMHLDWWRGFWNRSFVLMDTEGGNSSPPASTTFTAPPPSSSPPSSPPILPPTSQALLLHLDAQALGGQSSSSSGTTPIAIWPNSAPAGGGGNTHSPTQPIPALQPLLDLTAPPLGAPGVVFNGRGAYLEEATLVLPAQASTIVVLMADLNTTTTCCSGVFFAKGSCRGVSTAVGGGSISSSGGSGSGTHLLADWCYGTDAHTSLDIHGQVVVGTVVYAPSTTLPGNSSAHTLVNACPGTRDAAIPVADGVGFMVGSRNAELGRYFGGVVHELLVWGGALNASEVGAVGEYLRVKWGLSGQPTPPCPPPPPSLGFSIAQKCALQRYMAAIQSRSAFPIRFNGQAFVANRPPFADTRRWGILDCHQNTRLAYVPMLASGDGDLHTAWLEGMLRWVPLTQARTEHFFGHPGIFFTECKVPMGVPSSKHYDGACDPRTGTGVPSASRPLGYPLSEPCYSSGNAFEYGGDGGTPEVGLAALEHFYYTGNSTALQRYLPLAKLAATFYAHHYPRASNGTLRIFPSGVLEYYWCKWNSSTGSPSSDCCENDLPSVAGLTQLLEQLITVLPSWAATPQEVQEWKDLAASLPPLPMGGGGQGLLPAAVMCSAGSNPVEAPELYAVHPYRRYTIGRRAATAAAAAAAAGAAATPLDLTPAIQAFMRDSHANTDNTDWSQGVWQAALLGLVPQAVGLLSQRAMSPPAPGYSWPGFAPAYHDYAPVSELFAGLQSATNYMLLQPGDDAAGSMVLLPAWPCEWGVQFKLWGPLATSVEVVYTPPTVPGGGNGTATLVVTPESRSGAVSWGRCVG